MDAGRATGGSASLFAAQASQTCPGCAALQRPVAQPGPTGSWRCVNPRAYTSVFVALACTLCALGAPCQPRSSAAQDELRCDISGVLVAVRDAEVQGFAVGWRVADELQARTAVSGPPSGASRAPLKQSSLKPGDLF